MFNIKISKFHRSGPVPINSMVRFDYLMDIKGIQHVI